MQPFKKLKDHSGQGLLEAVAALGIMMTSLVAGLVLVWSNSNRTDEAQGRILAINLAREGIGVVRNIRDSNWLAGISWDQGLENGTDYTAIVIFDPTNNAWSLNFGPNNLSDCSGGVNDECRVYQSSRGVHQSTYFQAISQPVDTVKTPYFRLLTLNEICRDKVSGSETIRVSNDSCLGSEIKTGIQVIVEVKWFTKAKEHNLNIEDRIYNWK